MLLGFALFGLGGVAASAHSSFMALSVVGFLALFGGMLYQLFGFRCPRCGGRIGLALNSYLFSVPSHFRFCPFCGISLDTPLDATQRV
jgi:hypothetical protein